MPLSDDLTAKVKEIFKDSWSTRDGTVVPDPDDLKLGNDAVKLDGVVLYADLAESTDLVNEKPAGFAAEIYKTYLHCASKLIESEGGVITAFDGDRVMGVFIGDAPNTSAARCALKINYAVLRIINPAIKAQYSDINYEVKHSVGIDKSTLFVARTGVRGANDLVWVGRSANYAAKLCSLRTGDYATWITEDVYLRINANVKTHPDGRSRWVQHTWNKMGITVYASGWWWNPDYAP